MSSISPADDIAVRVRDLPKYAGFSKTKAYKLMAEGKWPRPHKLGEAPTSPVIWYLSEVREAVRRLEAGIPWETPNSDNNENSETFG
ncbi:MAG: AlpA family phage regulatory protein [Candidatus Competibacteraceae bacterium]|nr:AlpA family phage regulatory protein [Candidatus Competibacteraceae bacterium]